MRESLNLAFSVLFGVIVLWAVYLPLAWFFEERFFFGLMRKEGKTRQYWIQFFPTFLKRQLIGALALFVLLVILGILESIWRRDR
jgi:hypothetical protein